MHDLDAVEEQLSCLYFIVAARDGAVRRSEDDSALSARFCLKAFEIIRTFGKQAADQAQLITCQGGKYCGQVRVEALFAYLRRNRIGDLCKALKIPSEVCDSYSSQRLHNLCGCARRARHVSGSSFTMGAHEPVRFLQVYLLARQSTWMLTTIYSKGGQAVPMAAFVAPGCKLTHFGLAIWLICACWVARAFQDHLQALRRAFPSAETAWDVIGSPQGKDFLKLYCRGVGLAVTAALIGVWPGTTVAEKVEARWRAKAVDGAHAVHASLDAWFGSDYQHTLPLPLPAADGSLQLDALATLLPEWACPGGAPVGSQRHGRTSENGQSQTESGA